MQKQVAIAKASIIRPRIIEARLPVVIRPTHTYGDGLHTRLQAKLARAADRLLKNAGFIEEVLPPEDEIILLPADCIGNGILKPIWHGKA